MPKAVIDHIKKFTTISAPIVQDIIACTRRKVIRKDAILQTHAHDFVFVETGLLLKIDDLTDRTTHIIVENDILLFPPMMDPHSFVAVERCVLWIMPRADVLRLIAKDPGLCDSYDLLLRHWSRQRMQIVDLLLLPAAERKSAFYRRFKGIAHRIPNKHIASYLGISPSYFSRL